MTTIAGASRFINAATLANRQGLPAASTDLLTSIGTIDILDIGRSNSGIGLSASSRALTKQFLNATQSGFNSVFSLSTARLGSTEIIQQEILALRAKIPESQIAESLRGTNVDEEV